MAARWSWRLRTKYAAAPATPTVTTAIRNQRSLFFVRSRTLHSHQQPAGPQNDLQVQPPICLFDVLHVEANPFLKIEPLAARAAHLPQPGDAGANAQSR